jgi:GTP-binding protein
MTRLEALRDLEAQDPEAAAEEAARQRELQAEARDKIAALRASRASRSPGDDFDDDDHDVEIEYAP